MARSCAALGVEVADNCEVEDLAVGLVLDKVRSPSHRECQWRPVRCRRESIFHSRCSIFLDNSSLGGGIWRVVGMVVIRAGGINRVSQSARIVLTIRPGLFMLAWAWQTMHRLSESS